MPEGRRVYRSSAPNYRGSDATQRLTNDAVKFLQENRISGIISFSGLPYTPAELFLLGAAGIEYRHLPIPDFEAASLDQLLAAYNFVVDQGDDGGTLFHCGYGHGRTGTGITGIQLHTTHGENPDKSTWELENHVETPAQVAVLAKLRDSFRDSEAT
ncbi:hypothetical protein BD779DRAFT_1583351 [Infundibulicybe gibba]|nr:hypothetical protein BD779DRAFT_1583351 [Infundibulicybe gibba]